MIFDMTNYTGGKRKSKSKNKRKKSKRRKTFKKRT